MKAIPAGSCSRRGQKIELNSIEKSLSDDLEKASPAFAVPLTTGLTMRIYEGGIQIQCVTPAPDAKTKS